MCRLNHKVNQLWHAVVFLLALCSFSAGQTAVGWEKENFPDPQLNPTACGRYNVNSSYVCDPDGILTTSEGNHKYYIIYIVLFRHKRVNLIFGMPMSKMSNWTGVCE